jgi:tetratricopeptide (TPR) repeat protein
VQQLDGLPLAVELAAARVRTLPPVQLLHRLSAALDPVLELRDPGPDAPDRQRTLRATIAWSHELLTETERALLARLSVCTGGCTLDTAEVVGAVDGDVDVLDTLSALVEHSMLTAVDAGEGEPRFRMLELVRVFAEERLRERGEEEPTRLRLAEHLARVSPAAGAGLLGPDRSAWQARLEAEAVELQAALRWAVDHDRADLVLRIAAPLARWWWARDLVVPLAELADRTAGLPSAAELRPEDAGRLQWARGIARLAGGRTAEAAPLLAPVVDDARTRGDPWLLGHGLAGLAGTLPTGDPAARELLTEAVAALRRTGDPWSVAFALVPLGDAAHLSGDLPTALEAHEEALDLARRTHDDHLVATVLDRLGMDAVAVGDLTAAKERLAESAGLHRQVRDQEGLANCLDGLAGLVLAHGVPRVAARLAGAADAARAALGVAGEPLLRRRVDRLSEAIRAGLGADDEPRERAAGAALGPWVALDTGLAAVAAAEELTTRSASRGPRAPVRTVEEAS